MRILHSDKTGDGDDSAGKFLNDAKERALKAVTDTSMTLGEKAQQEFEESIGQKANEESMDDFWKKMTGQTGLRAATTEADSLLAKNAEKWADKDVFKQYVFGMMSKYSRYADTDCDYD